MSIPDRLPVLVVLATRDKSQSCAWSAERVTLGYHTPAKMLTDFRAADHVMSDDAYVWADIYLKGKRQKQDPTGHHRDDPIKAIRMLLDRVDDAHAVVGGWFQ